MRKRSIVGGAALFVAGLGTGAAVVPAHAVRYVYEARGEYRGASRDSLDGMMKAATTGKEWDQAGCVKLLEQGGGDWFISCSVVVSEDGASPPLGARIVDGTVGVVGRVRR